MPLHFRKMHGAGNDFVMLDARDTGAVPGAAALRALADRRRGVGCDQVVVLLPGADGAAAHIRFFNGDGGESGACGNGLRCAADLLLPAGGGQLMLSTAAGPRAAWRNGAGVRVDMGPPRLGWREIPLARDMDTLHLDFQAGPLADPVAVSMGNPHCVFLVEDPAAIDLAALGPVIEHDPLFPERVNVGIASVTGPDAIALRVWERGAGLTLACGTGACAALVAAHRRGLCGRRADIAMPGGLLQVEWGDDGHLLLGGPTATSFTGVWDHG